MTRLLHKPLKVFAIYALLILASSIPVYYFIVDSIWLEELDEHNQIIRAQTQQGFTNLKQQQDDLEKSLELWRQVQPGVIIYPANAFKKDSVYTIERVIPHNGEIESDRFRGLVSSIKIARKPYRIQIETNVEEAHETVFAISLITFAFLIILIIGFILLNNRLSKKIWQPFIDTLDQLKQFNLSHNVAVTFTDTNITEFKELNAVLSKLIESNLLVYNQQKEFLQNASHELQTPLALVQSKIDILIQDNSLTRQQRETIESLSASVSRVSKINKNLLLLAGIENKTFASEKLLLNDILNRILIDYKEIYPSKQVRSETLNKITLKTNEGLLEILINNLISNSFRHSEEDAKICVEVVDRKLIIKNTGTQSLKVEALFKRFQSASGNNPGTGLGLAISKEICNKYGWKISYQFLENEHQFSVLF